MPDPRSKPKGVVSFKGQTIQAKVRCARSDCVELFIRDVVSKYDFDKLLEIAGWTFHWKTGWVCPECKPTMPAMLAARFAQMQAKFKHHCEKCPPGEQLSYGRAPNTIRRWRWMRVKVGEEWKGGPELDFPQCPYCLEKLPKPFHRHGRLGNDQYYWDERDGHKTRSTRRAGR